MRGRADGEERGKNGTEPYTKSVYRIMIETIVSAIIALSSVILIFTSVLLVPMIYKINPLSIFLLQERMDWYFLISLIFSIVLLIFSIIYLERKVKLLSSRFVELSTGESIAEQSRQILGEQVLQYLDEGEKRIYGVLSDAGGSVLQKDMVGLDGMSRATVSRIVDRLEKKGVVDKIRHGSTNMVVLKRLSR